MAQTDPKSHKGPNSIISSLDIEKAFDTLGWEYLLAVWSKFDMGPKFLRWVKILYTKPQARVKTGHIISPSFGIERGMRQGCPLSPIIFALAMEPLASVLLSRVLDWGIQVHMEWHIVSLYVDDALVYLRGQNVVLEDLMKVLDEHARISGLKVNWSKSVVFPMEPLTIAQRRNLPTTPLTWAFNSFKYLGVQIYNSPDRRQLGQSNC